MSRLQRFIDLLLSRSTPVTYTAPSPLREWPGLRGRALLFLDFDGVLHHHQSGTFCWLPELHSILDACPWLDVVLSTNWRTGRRAFLLEQLDVGRAETLHLAERVRDITGPELSGLYKRHDEILAFARSRGARRFVALDDAPFPPTCEWVFRTDPNEGIGGDRCREALAFIQRLLSPE